MARRRAQLPSVFKYRLSPGVETLEDRAAPGCVLDVLGLTVSSPCQSLASSLASEIAAQDRDESTRVPSERIKPVVRELPTNSRQAAAGCVASRTESSHREPRDRILSSLGHSTFDGTNFPDPSDGIGPAPAGKNARSALVVSSFAPPVELQRGASDVASSSAPLDAGAPRDNRPNSSASQAGNFSMLDVAAEGDTSPRESRVPRGLPYAHEAELVQSTQPYELRYESTGRGPTTGVVKSPAEYEPMRGVLFSYANYASIVTDMVKELTEDPTKDDIAYVVVSSQAQQTSATSSFTSAGADMSKVQFFIQPSNSVWMRDYGPHFITVDDSLAIVDSHYYPNRPLDNFIPTLLGDNNFNVPTYDMGLYYSGGNFQPGPNNSAFVTSLVNYHNTATDGFNASFISELYHSYQGIDTLHVMPQLPFSVDGTGHIDMWMYLVDQDTVVISEFAAGANSTAIEITNNAVSYMQNLGFNVHRTPAWNVGSTHYTYANAFRVNDRIFVPVYGTALKPGGNASYNDEDANAVAAWRAAAGPGVEIIPIQSSQIIPAAGAIHCIVKQVPRHIGSVPAANVISPAGGELLLIGDQHKIEWSAIDTNNVDPAEIGIYVAYDGGEYRHLATTTDTGSYLWTISGSTARNATIKIIAKSADNDQVEAFSDPFTIARGAATEYDFSSGAGVNKFAYGWQTSAWASINGNPSPVGTQLSSSNYAAISTSNATGGDSDSNRYVAPVPNPVGNESTHQFTFKISEPVPAFAPIDRLAQIDVHWEGYADFCSQVELYVWDLVAQNWGDATGLTGNNRYMASWAGNADGDLDGSIRSDFSRYVDGSGWIRFLVYADRTGTNPDTQHNAGQGIETFHDYMSVSVKRVDFTTKAYVV